MFRPFFVVGRAMLKNIFGDGKACFFFVLLLCLFVSGNSSAQQQGPVIPDAPRPQPGVIVGTVVDVNNDAVPGATVVLESPMLQTARTVVSNDNGLFEFHDVDPQTYHVKISAPGFADWTSSDVALSPGQYVILPVPKLQIAMAVTSVTVGYSAVEVATQEVKLEEKQRVFGIIPNFYIAYDQGAAPLTAKLKFQLAAKVSFDPITFVGVGIAAAAEQAGDHPNYPRAGRASANAMALPIPMASP